MILKASLMAFRDPTLNMDLPTHHRIWRMQSLVRCLKVDQTIATYVLLHASTEFLAQN